MGKSPEIEPTEYNGEPNDDTEQDEEVTIHD